jgi:DNA-binding MarR family transcriptional regulator
MQQSTASEHVVSLLAEIHALGTHLKYARQPFQKQEEWPSGVRSVLLILGRNGPRTVPEIGRERNTSRQNVQIVVNRLKRAGLVDFESNPAHKRSVLVRLTEKGRTLLTGLEEAESNLKESLVTELSPDELAVAIKCLRRMRQLLSGGPEPPSARKRVHRVSTPVRTAPQPPQEEDLEDFPLNLL